LGRGRRNEPKAEGQAEPQDGDSGRHGSSSVRTRAGTEGAPRGPAEQGRVEAVQGSLGLRRIPP
jgi:hypothetical protein